jgi:transcriptional regulator with GAF, ATPase, and Fis domain
MTDQELQGVKNRYGIIGNTPGINHALNTAAQVATTDLTVLIQGESGVGKEVFSQIIHSLSSRKHNSFIAINCGAIPEGTIDSELFGHEKGSFTSAVDARKGYFETVNGGTIFLDEIGEMPLGTQARLLRVLETGEFIRVGSSKVQKTSVRVIAATNRDLLQQVQVNKFREDLYYRLSTVPIRVPALRERKDDIYQLFRKFCVDFAEKYRTTSVQLNEEAREVLINYNWPGNVRQLKNIAEQVSVLSTNKNISGQAMINYLPVHSPQDLTPILSGASGNTNSDFNSERDILYKLFFDMKKDVTDLKKAFFEIAQGGNNNYSEAVIGDQLMPHFNNENWNNNMIGNNVKTGNIILNQQENNTHTPHQEVEEVLNIAEKEKELIIKSLLKHRNKRRDAAKELGISERTLYRKIKEYDIED